MKEQDLIDLGFERIDVSVGEDFYYYTYDFTKGFCMISSDNYEAEDKGWFIDIFNDHCARLYNKEDVKTLIDLINRNKI